MANLNAKEYQRFEDIKHTTDEGMEFWYARELAPVLEYAEWRNFNKVVNKAMLACKNSGFSIEDHFVEVSKTIPMPKGAMKKAPDYMLSRYACYLVMQNGDARKGLAPDQKILDHMGSVELAAKLFRITQTEEIMNREQPQGLDAASNIHHTVGKEVRETIARIGGTMPEDLPTPEKSISQIEREQLKQLKKDRKKLMLDE